MTMLDDDRLASLLAGAAATFEAPVTGPDDILERALGRGDEGGDEVEAVAGHAALPASSVWCCRLWIAASALAPASVV